MSPALREIREALTAAATEEAAAASRRFVPTAIRVYGVRVPVLNQLARQYKAGGFDLATELWHSGAFDERLLAAKILHYAGRHDPERTLALLHEFSAGITDWAVCDTLGTQSVKKIVSKNGDQVLQAARELVKSPMMWQRRLGIVLLTHFAKQPARKEEILSIVKPLRLEKEHYIRKAIAWVDRGIAR